MKHVVLVFVLLASFSAQAQEFSQESYKGQVLYIDFWASWCGPCKESFPWLNQMHKKFKDKGLTIVGINLDKDKSQADDFLKAHPALFPVFFNADGTLAKKYGVKGMPYTVIIDKNGKIIDSHIGFHADKTDQYIKIIEGALQ